MYVVIKSSIQFKKDDDKNSKNFIFKNAFCFVMKLCNKNILKNVYSLWNNECYSKRIIQRMFFCINPSQDFWVSKPCFD